MRTIQISNGLINQTIDELQRSGAKGHERVVLWLGIPGDVVRVMEVFVPQQTTASDYFHISREGMAQYRDFNELSDEDVESYLRQLMKLFESVDQKDKN